MEEKAFATGMSTSANWREAVKEAAARVKKELAGRSCDLAFFFVSETYDGLDPQHFVKALADALPYRVLLGCNSSGIIAGRNEIEMEPAVSILGMHLPGVKLYPFTIPPAETNSLHDGTKLIKYLDIYPTDKPRFMVLADPSTCDIVKLLHGFNEGYKGLPVVGGLASGGVMGVPNWLALNGQAVTEGAVGVAMIGNVEFQVLVSQGCRPIGKPYIVTKCDDNTLYELAGRPALVVVRELLEGLTGKDRGLAEHSLSVGLAMDERKTEFKRGDFLIRNIIGFDPDAGTLVIGAHLKVGQTLQFQLRDADTSSEDLKHLLEKMPAKNGSPRGGILVSCCGRGRQFYGRPDHDASAIQASCGPLSLAGFFANGEIGPIGDKNFVHGYTSSLVILK